MTWGYEGSLGRIRALATAAFRCNNRFEYSRRACLTRSKKQIKLLWVACGNNDNLLRISQGVHAYLKGKGIPHVWHVDGHAHDSTEWRNNLYYFAQKLFR